MKTLKALYLGMAMTASVAMVTSCQADMDAPELVAPVATMTPNTTIADLKTTFANQIVECPMKDEDTQTPYIIHGRVISSDATGNIYKSLVIQDETAAIALSINQGSTYNEYRLGQEVVLNVTGLYVGEYNGLQQIGWLGDYNGEPQVTFMAWSEFLSHSELNGFPNNNVEFVSQDATWPSANPYCVVTSIGQLPGSGTPDFRKMQSQLVRFNNVHFEEGGKETYAPYQESVNRTLVDASGATLTVRTSGYSNFYNQLIPEGTGTVDGILSYYGDGWQLLLRSTEDVHINDKGQKDDPYTVAEAQEICAGGQNLTGWTTAYIVGSVKLGVKEVTSNADIIFGIPTKEEEEDLLDNNIVIAASPTETNWENCMVVALPQNTAFREKVNLVDNPDVLGLPILVSGTLTTLYGMPAIADNGGTAADVEVEGVTIEGGETPGGESIPAGDGTKESPYNADQIKSASPATGMWMEGYVVGYVADKAWSSAVFGTEPSETDNYKNATNVVLSMVAPGKADASNSVPVGLKKVGDVRTTLGISQNPSIYGARVKVKGEVTSYFGMTSMKNVEEYVIVSEGEGGDTPTPPAGDETVIYSSLGKALTAMPDDWTIDNVTKPEAVTNVWAWKVYNGSGYLNASAFANNTASPSLAYAISPEIDLTGYKTVKASFRHAAKFQTTLKELCGFVVRESGSTTWTEITIPEWPAAGAWTFVGSGDMDLSAFAGKKIQVAFKYGSSDAGADTWEINDIEISGSK